MKDSHLNDFIRGGRDHFLQEDKGIVVWLKRLHVECHEGITNPNGFVIHREARILELVLVGHVFKALEKLS